MLIIVRIQLLDEFSVIVVFRDFTINLSLMDNRLYLDKPAIAALE